MRKFEATYRSTATIRALFLERYTENGHVVRSEAGTAYFRRPRKMRWEYESPAKNLFLVDGKTAWFYIPADRIVMRAPAKDSTDWRTPLALLAGEMKVSRVCARVELAAAEKSLDPLGVVIQCILRGTQSKDTRTSSGANHTASSDTPEAVFFEVSRDSGELTRILVRQNDGAELEFRFGNWRFNPPISESQFHFDPPLGVAIVNGELPHEPGVTKP